MMVFQQKADDELNEDTALKRDLSLGSIVEVLQRNSSQIPHYQLNHLFQNFSLSI